MIGVIVVGGGLAGLAAAMRLAQCGIKVSLVSLTKVKRSHSVCAQGGINVAVNLMGEGDSPEIHSYDTIKGGDFLGDQPPIVEMCFNGPTIIRMLDRMGVPFNRTPEGVIDFRRFGGTLYKRTAFSGSSTGQQLLYAFDEQVRRFESKGLVVKYEHHEFLRAVIDENGLCRGVILSDLYNSDIFSLRASAVIIATGGNGAIFKYSTNSTICTGAAVGRLYRQGAWMANPEFVQIHPTAIPGVDKLRLISESVRGEGGRVWVYGDSSKRIVGPDGKKVPCGKTGLPWYFFEEIFPGYGNLVPRDVAARYMMKVVDQGLGIDGKKQVYLDVVDLPESKRKRVDSVLEMYQKFTGDDPRKVPMRIYPAVHYSMGGLWVDFPATGDVDRFKRYRQMTNLSGLFAAGECEFLYHGANRLGANSLLSCIYGGMVAANEANRYIKDITFVDRAESSFKKSHAKEIAIRQSILESSGSENIHDLHDELGEVMIEQCTVFRRDDGLDVAMEKISEIKERFKYISLDDKGSILNQTYQFANQFTYMLDVAFAIAKGARHRNEFRGSHYKENYPNRDDINFLKSTIADVTSGECSLRYLPVDSRHLSPEIRDYTKAKRVKVALSNMPSNIPLVTDEDYGI